MGEKSPQDTEPQQSTHPLLPTPNTKAELHTGDLLGQPRQ